MNKLKQKASTNLHADERGLIPLLLGVLAVVVGLIVFAYIRVSHAN
jgi:hypothetical protein